ncbi:hypothetical protein [Agrococcus sp. DT81.2]|uniref:hypothetical protein n=1 Tax=Agrococcus sp. DT81.2 TaxID=3393414 RepID=UPI003CE55D55
MGAPARGTAPVIGGLLLAALAIATASAIDPAEHGIAGAVRVWALGAVVAGLVIAIMAALPSPSGAAPTPQRPRVRGLLLAGTAALVVTMKVSVDRESSWFTVVVGTALLSIGVADFLAERRRVRNDAGAE